MTRLNTITIICIFAALLATTTANQGTTTTTSDQGTTTTAADQGTTTVTQGTTTTDHGTTGTTDQGTTSTTAKQGPTTTATTAYRHTYSGSLTMTATSVTKEEMETALTNAFANRFNVYTSAVSVTATESRRLVQTALRKWVGAWSISFAVKVVEHHKASMDTKVSAVMANTTTLAATLKTRLVQVGVSQSAVSSLQVSSATLALVLVTTTTHEMTTTMTATTATCYQGGDEDNAWFELL